MPDAKGAYLLLIKIGRSVDLPPRFACQILDPGLYGYAGSAYGPGGIRARCRRHLSRPEALRWHVDWLTHSAVDVQAVAFPGSAECRVIDRLVERAHARFPITGFGSTDCQRCCAHLVELADKDGLDEVIGNLLS